MHHRLANPAAARALAQAAATMALAASLACACAASPRAGALRRQDLRVIVHGAQDVKEVALTFDDGPHPRYNFTPRLLAMLKKLDVKATFFVVGQEVDQSPWIVARMVAEGHEVGNHTYDHPNLTRVPPGLVSAELAQCSEAIVRACGVAPTVFRPPGGQYDDATVAAVARAGMRTVLWTDDPADYLRPHEKELEQKLLMHVRPGAVFLLHDGVEQTLDVLPAIVARMRQEGYQFVTLSHMVKRLDAAASAQRGETRRDARNGQ